jgi:histidinol-phosphate aminotransferase
LCTSDPESNELRTALSKHLGNVSVDQLVCGCGSDELLDLVLRLFEPRAIVTCSPTFGMYRFLGKINHCEVRFLTHLHPGLQTV